MNIDLTRYLENLIFREDYFKDFDSFIFAPFIKIIVGARRVGKSYFLFQIIKKLLDNKIFSEKEIFYINKEWLDFDIIKNYEDLNDYFLKWKSENNINDKFFIGIDEIQEIKDWQKFILSIWSKYPKSVILITGSNSKLLSRDIGTKLRGRYISKMIYPLTLKEFSKFKKQEITEQLFREYIRFGGLPAISFINDENIKLEYLKGVYNTIFVKDLLEYENIKYVNLLKLLHKLLFKEIGHIINGKNIVDYLKSQNIKVSVETILNYIEFSINAFLFNEVFRYDIKDKKIFEINKKYYTFDLGIRNSIVGLNMIEDIGGIFENLVYNYLIFRGYEVFVGKLYDKEIDFVAKKGNEIIYIQVAYSLGNSDTFNREFGNLLKIKNGWRKIVVSGDRFIEGKYEGIEHINIIDFLQMDI